MAPGSRVGVGGIHPVRSRGLGDDPVKVSLKGVFRVRQHVEDAVLFPGAVRVEEESVFPCVHYADKASGREGLSRGERQARPGARPGLELVAHVEGEAVGEVGGVGVDEGAVTRAQHGVPAGEGEGGGVGRASSGDFQRALPHRQGGALVVNDVLDIPAEDGVAAQQEGATIEGGVGHEVVVAAGSEVGFIPLVEFAAEDDGSVCVVNLPFLIRAAVERESKWTVGVFIPAGNRVVEADFPPLLRGKCQRRHRSNLF